MRIRHVVASLVAMLTTAAPAQDVASAWRTLAASDAAAALQLIETNHPGAAPELKDEAFAAQLATARRHLTERLPGVASLGGYNALLNGLSADFADEHIWTRPGRDPADAALGRHRARLARRALGGRRRPASWSRPLAQGRDHPVLRWSALRRMGARGRGGFHGDPTADATLLRAGPSLLTDHDNPFVAMLAECVFALESTRISVRLEWRSDAQTTWQAALDAAQPVADAGMACSPFRAACGSAWAR